MTDLARAFRAHVGDEKFLSLYRGLQLLSPGDYQLRYWQEKLVGEFLNEWKTETVTVETVLNAVSDRTRFLYACPSVGCAFFANCMNDEPNDQNDGQWLCPECGHAWDNTQDLFEAIRKAISEYPYLVSCYTRANGEIVPAAQSFWVENYRDACTQELNL